MRGFKYLLRREEILLFPDWERIFGRKGELYFEIGVGNGEFIVEMAKREREANFIGVEVSKEVLRKALSRLEESGVENVRLLCMEGAEALCALFKSNTLSGLYLNFPDPWPKKKHQKRRLVKASFLYVLSDRLKVGGFFRMATDHREYAEEVVKLFSEVPSFSPLWESPIKKELDDFYPTKYARKWLSQGKEIYFIGFKKEKNVEIPLWVREEYPILKLEEEEVSVSILNIFKRRPSLDFAFLSKALRGRVLYQGDKLFIKVLEVFYNEESLLLEILLKEGEITQQFFIKISPYGKEGYLMRIHESDKVYPTEGVHLAFVLLLKIFKEGAETFELIKSTCKEKFLKRVFE